MTFVGIGVDYGIHLVHRYRERGDARPAIAELAPVILVAGAITLLGYGTLVDLDLSAAALDRPGLGRQRASRSPPRRCSCCRRLLMRRSAT